MGCAGAFLGAAGFLATFLAGAAAGAAAGATGAADMLIAWRLFKKLALSLNLSERKIMSLFLFNLIKFHFKTEFGLFFFISNEILI